MLKRWKVSQGLALDQRILVSDPRLAMHWHALQLNAITWIPQLRSRSWRLGGSPAEKLAHWVSAQIGIQAFSFLAPRGGRGPRQAQLGIHERLANRLRFEWNEQCPASPHARVLLVDDFMTTGRTLRAAAQVLRSRGTLAVHVFCLGVRPFRGDEARSERLHLGQAQCLGDLDQCAGRTITISEEEKTFD